MSKLKKILPIVIFAIITILIGSLLFEKCNNNVEHKAFLSQMDSLHKVNDSLEAEIAKDDAEIDSLDIVAIELQYKVDHQKSKVKTIVEYIEIEKNSIDAYSDPELVTSFNNRYPTDTISNPLLVAQPVLVSAAKDLVELDGAKQIIVLKDSSIATLESQVAVKDTIISKYVSKENNYKNIMNNQQTQIKDWKFQYNTLQLQNQKLKLKNKFTKIGAGLVVGGLVYLMLAK
jgi:hypothetical protein